MTDLDPPAHRVPASAADLTSPVMAAALGRAVTVTEVARVGEAFGFAGASYRVRLDGSDVPDAVVAKLWPLRDPDDMVELHFYRELASKTPLPLPAYHHGAVDPASGRAWIVLDALDDFRQGDDLVDESLSTVLDLTAAVAGVHAAWWDRVHDRAWLDEAPRFRRDPDYLATRRVDYLDRFGPIDDPPTAALFNAIPDLVPVADRLLAPIPPTLVHQDLALDNVLFLRPGDRPLPIDWARCGRGPGVLDLASLLFTVAPLDGFAEIVDRYATALEDAGVPYGGPVPLLQALGGAMVHEFVTRTLGVARWNATTPRGLLILERSVARVPAVVDAWRRLDPDAFDRTTGLA